MFGIHDFGLFMATGVILNLTPGPDTFYILGRSISQGRSAGIASALGIASGGLIHTLAAALGLSALLAVSTFAFLAVKILGAGYLVYLGVRMLSPRATGPALSRGFPEATFPAIFRQGLLTNVLNPKVAIFFLALMPQFIDGGSPHKFAAFLTLGLCFVATGTIWCFCLAWFASLLGEKLRGGSFGKMLNRAVGILFIFLGVRLACGN